MKEKFCKSHISYKELTSSIYKKFNNKNTTQFKNQQSIWQNISPKEAQGICKSKLQQDSTLYPL